MFRLFDDRNITIFLPKIPLPHIRAVEEVTGRCCSLLDTEPHILIGAVSIFCFMLRQFHCRSPASLSPVNATAEQSCLCWTLLCFAGIRDPNAKAACSLFGRGRPMHPTTGICSYIIPSSPPPSIGHTHGGHSCCGSMAIRLLFQSSPYGFADGSWDLESGSNPSQQPWLPPPCLGGNLT